nr:YciI family protein [Micromonospora sp. DSM 115978]
MMIIYGNQQLWESYPDVTEMIAGQDAWNRKYFGTGELLGAYGNADAAQAKTVRVRDGQPAVTDGPYLETKEYLASWYLLDVDSEARALALAG